MLPVRIPLLLLPALLGAASLVAAAPAPRKSWELGRFTWIKRIPAEPGAPPNQHPVAVEAKALQPALASLQVTVDKEDEPLFTASEVTGLARALSEALAAAGPGEDLELVATTNRSSFVLASSLSVTARVFAEGGHLHLLFKEVRGDITYSYHLDGRTPAFPLGSRQRAAAVAVKPGEGLPQRPDWVRFPLVAPGKAPTPVPPPAPTVAPALRPAPAAAPSPAPVTPAAPAAPAAPTGSLEDRLARLKRLRDQNLITEEEYTRRKAELLREL